LSAVFKEFDNYIKDITIIGRRVAVCYAHQEPIVLKGTILQIIFDSQSWNCTIICTEAKQKRKMIYSMVMNHLLFNKLQVLGRMNKIEQIHTQDVSI